MSKSFFIRLLASSILHMAGFGGGHMGGMGGLGGMFRH
jgi:hypothetical protein